MKRCVLLLSFTVACYGAEKPLAPPVAAPSKIIDYSLPATSIGEAPVGEVAKVVDRTYRVRPDRRVLLAVADLVALNSGRDVRVEIDFDSDHWRVRCDGHEAGTLPEVPTYADGLSLLTEWARNLRPSTPQTAQSATLVAIDSDLATFTSPSLFHALQQTDPSRGALDGPLLARLARAITLINLKTIDRFGLADSLRSRALALIAMARVVDPTAVGDETAVMAQVMGYESEASKLAGALPDASFARAWITGRVPPRPTDAVSQYVAAAIAIRSAKGESPGDALAAWSDRLGSRGVPLLLLNTSFATASQSARDVASLIAAEVGDPQVESANPAKYRERDPDEALREAESALPKRSSALASVAVPADLVRAHYEALLYSAFDEEFRFYLDRKASGEESRQFVEVLRPESPSGREVVAWMTAMTTAKYGSDPAAAIASLKNLTRLGGARRAELLIMIGNRIGRGEAVLRPPLDSIFSTLDSRSDEIYAAATLSLSMLGDPLRRDRYMTLAIARAPGVIRFGSLAWYYFLTGDVDQLRSLVDRSDAAATDRALAADYLSQLGKADDDFIDAHFRKLVAEVGYDHVYSTYAGILNRRHAWKAKERLAREALAANEDGSPIAVAYYASSLADALEQQGRYEEAWRVIEPHLRVWSANVVSGGVSLLQRRGRPEEANRLGAKMVERYPEAGTRMDFAVVLWREGSFDEGGQLFDPKRVTVSRSEWDRWVPDSFADAFESDPTSAAKAFRSLIGVKVDPDLLESIPREFLDRKQEESAFALAELLAQHRPVTVQDPYAASHAILAYRALKSWNGEAAASEWLRARVSDAAALQMVSIAYQEGEYELLAALLAPRANARKQIEMESYYAAALVQMRVSHDDPRWQELLAETKAQTPAADSLLVVTQYLLDLVDEAAFVAQAKTAEWKSTVEYFVGLKAAAAGDYDRAIPLMIAAARGPNAHPPQVWAAGLLFKWANEKATWAQIKKRGVL